MLKYLLALTAAAAATAQTVEPLPYTQNLDPSFVVSWGLTNDTITVELLYASTGWGGLYLLSEDGSLLDVWWGGYDEDYSTPYLQDGYAQLDGLKPGPRYPDTFQNLNLVSFFQPPFGTSTRLRFQRPFVTTDRNDVLIPEKTRQSVIWAFADNDVASTPAKSSGATYITFRP